MLHKWQQDFIEKMTKYKGRGVVMTTGRQTGKSLWSAQAIDRLMKDMLNRPVEDMLLTEARVHGARYYCVEPVGGNWKDMEKWVREICGDPGDMWESSDFVWPEAARWMMNNRKFWFRSESDRTMFVMKWR